MDLHELRRLFEEWCRSVGGIFRKGRNPVGDEVLLCVRPARGSFINVQGMESGIMVSVGLTAARFGVPEDYEIVFSDGSGWIKHRAFMYCGLQINEPDIVAVVPEEKRIYIGSEKEAPPWARVEVEEL